MLDNGRITCPTFVVNRQHEENEDIVYVTEKEDPEMEMMRKVKAAHDLLSELDDVGVFEIWTRQKEVQMRAEEFTKMFRQEEVSLQFEGGKFPYKVYVESEGFEVFTLLTQAEYNAYIGAKDVQMA